MLDLYDLGGWDLHYFGYFDDFFSLDQNLCGNFNEGIILLNNYIVVIHLILDIAANLLAVNLLPSLAVSVEALRILVD